jgi:hypothetical protein
MLKPVSALVEASHTLQGHWFLASCAKLTIPFPRGGIFGRRQSKLRRCSPANRGKRTTSKLYPAPTVCNPFPSLPYLDVPIAWHRLEIFPIASNELLQPQLLRFQWREIASSCYHQQQLQTIGNHMDTAILARAYKNWVTYGKKYPRNGTLHMA